MIKAIKYLLTVGLIFDSTIILAQEKVLRLSGDCKYEMYFVNVQFRGDQSLQVDTINAPGKNRITISWDRTESFAIDDSVVIHKLKDQWMGVRTNEAYGCWYDYFIYLVENDVVIDEIRVNDVCKQVITNYGVFNYSDSPLEALNKDKKIAVADLTFNELRMGRDFIDDAKRLREIFMPRIGDAEWYRFDGEMIVKTKRGAIDKREREISEKIKTDFPGEKVDVQFLFSLPKDLLFYVYCSENLGTKFTGFRKGRGWERFHPLNIFLISKTEAPIKELIEKYTR